MSRLAGEPTRRWGYGGSVLQGHDLEFGLWKEAKPSPP